MALKGAREHAARLQNLGQFSPDVSRALFAGGERIAVAAQLSITSGSVSGKGHVPSAPGEPPNQDTGVLAGNIEVTQPSPLVVEVSSNAPYSRALEDGTSKMAARPFMRPARDKERRNVEQLVRRAMDRVKRR